jgi:uncharacterized HhH-GPD family protein
MQGAITPERLPWTGDDEADRLLASDPLALLIGFVLDQQVTLQKAFSGPLELCRRIGSLDARTIASMDTGELEATFARRPALHRFPGNMARRTQALCVAIVRDYDGRAERVWTEAKDARDLERRLLAQPGVGEMKAKTLLAVLGKQFGIRPAGWEDVAPHHPTLGDADTPEAVAAYQAGKRARKAAMRAGLTLDEGGGQVSHHIKGETGGKKGGTERDKAGSAKSGSKPAPKK